MEELVPRSEVEKLRGKKRAIVELLLDAHPGGYTNVSLQAVGGFNYTARISDLRKEWLPEHGLEIVCVDPGARHDKSLRYYRIQKVDTTGQNMLQFPVEGKVQMQALQDARERPKDEYVPGDKFGV